MINAIKFFLGYNHRIYGASTIEFLTNVKFS
jgi:hypothetical protein